MTELQELMKTEVHIPLCSCGKPMAFQETEKTWRCLACNPIPLDAPICKTVTCKRPLTWLEKTGCWRCLRCNPIVEVKPEEKPERNYIDVTMTQDKVRDMIKKEMAGIGDIVRETMAEFNIKDEPDPDYPSPDPAARLAEQKARKPEGYLQIAKRLGIATHKETGGMRKKEDVLAEIEKGKASETNSSTTRLWKKAIEEDNI